MSGSQSTCRTLGRMVAAVLAGGLLASTALGTLTIHLTLPQGLPPGVPPAAYGGAMAVDPLAPVPVEMQIWAVVTDGNGDMSDDGLSKFYSAFYSSLGGVVLGDLMASPAMEAYPSHGPYWFGGEAASLGDQADLDGDGDLDIGSTDVEEPSPPWFQIRHAAGMQFSDEVWILKWQPMPGNPINAWHVADVTFTPTVAGPEFDPTGPSGITEIWADPRQYAAAQWTEDGLSKINYLEGSGEENRGILEGGEKVVLYVASHAEAPSGGGPFVVVQGGPALILEGTASTGSVNWWGWDFDGDGTYEIEGIGQSAVEVSYDDLKAMGLEDMVPYTAMMTVGWSQSPVINTDTVAFDLTIIPEPATLALLLGGCLITRVRRRR